MNTLKRPRKFCYLCSKVHEQNKNIFFYVSGCCLFLNKLLKFKSKTLIIKLINSLKSVGNIYCSHQPLIK